LVTRPGATIRQSMLFWTWDTQQKFQFTLGFCMLNFSIAWCPCGLESWDGAVSHVWTTTQEELFFLSEKRLLASPSTDFCRRHRVSSCTHVVGGCCPFILTKNTT
jgi:hypothetical protein